MGVRFSPRRVKLTNLLRIMRCPPAGNSTESIASYQNVTVKRALKGHSVESSQINVEGQIPRLLDPIGSHAPYTHLVQIRHSVTATQKRFRPLSQWNRHIGNTTLVFLQRSSSL